MEHEIASLWQQGTRVLIVVLVPTLLIPAVGLLSGLLQGMMGVREEGFQYALRTLALAGVILVFGASFASAFIELMQMALR